MASPQEARRLIFHPAQENGLIEYDQASATIRQNLEPRFSDFNGTEMERNAFLTGITNTLELETIRSEATRHAHEKMNAGRIGRANPDKYLAIDYYHHVAAAPETAPELVYWFAHLGSLTLDAEPDEHDVPPEKRIYDKIGIDLGGTMQYADWENTGPLDAMAQTIPSRLLEFDPTIRLRLFSKPPVSEQERLPGVEYEPEIPKNYLLLPYFLQNPHNGRYFRYALLRRWRGVADVDIAGKRRVEIYKDTSALIIPSQMPEELAEQLYEPYATAGYNTPAIMNGPSSILAGGRFDVASREPEGTTRDVIPVGAHYVMRMYRDGRQSKS